MAINFGPTPPQTLDLNSGNVSANWKKFKQKYFNYEIATGISKKGDAIRVATLLTVIGNEYWTSMTRSCGIQLGMITR